MRASVEGSTGLLLIDPAASHRMMGAARPPQGTTRCRGSLLPTVPP